MSFKNYCSIKCYENWCLNNVLNSIPQEEEYYENYYLY